MFVVEPRPALRAAARYTWALCRSAQESREPRLKQRFVHKRTVEGAEQLLAEDTGEERRVGIESIVHRTGSVDRHGDRKQR